MTLGPRVGNATRSSDSPEQTERLGEALAPTLRDGDVVSLSGPLGAGKTRFVAGLARGLAAKARVRSPSFTLVNEYDGRVRLLHLDLYRLETPAAEGLGLDEALERGALVVEWGEKLPDALLADALRVTVEVGEGDARAFHAEADGGRGLELLEAWRAAGA
jgi:tRNA threonylcarbamoyladenosine biosynthesis protein TsaE